MDYKAARIWQNVLLFGGAIVSAVGVWAFNSMPIMLVGLGMMIFSIIAWWRYYRCPKCGEHLAAARRRAAPSAAHGSPARRNPSRRRKFSTKKKKH